ncbi:hypothetical protein D3C84_1024060 [compost metagenome]
MLVEAVLQGILDGIAGLHQPVELAAFSAYRLQLEQRTDRTVVLQQEAAAVLQVFDPR